MNLLFSLKFISSLHFHSALVIFILSVFLSLAETSSASSSNPSSPSASFSSPSPHSSSPQNPVLSLLTPDLAPRAVPALPPKHIVTNPTLADYNGSIVNGPRFWYPGSTRLLIHPAIDVSIASSTKGETMEAWDERQTLCVVWTQPAHRSLVHNSGTVGGGPAHVAIEVPVKTGVEDVVARSHEEEEGEDGREEKNATKTMSKKGLQGVAVGMLAALKRSVRVRSSPLSSRSASPWSNPKASAQSRDDDHDDDHEQEHKHQRHQHGRHRHFKRTAAVVAAADAAQLRDPTHQPATRGINCADEDTWKVFRQRAAEYLAVQVESIPNIAMNGVPRVGVDLPAGCAMNAQEHMVCAVGSHPDVEIVVSAR